MRRKSIAAFGSTLIAALALVAAGCGGGSSNSAATTATEAATTEAATTEAVTTEAATTTETTTTTDLSGIASAGDCRELKDLGETFSSAFTGAGNSQDVKKQAALVQEFAKKVPSDIRADFQVIADYFSKFAEIAGSLKAGETPDAETLAKLQKLSTEVDQAKLTQASQRITAWVRKNCNP